MQRAVRAAVTPGGVERRNPTRLRRRREPEPPRLLRWAFYLFICSIPFETFETGFESTASISRIAGYAMVLVALFFPTVSFRRIPRSLPWFTLYFAVCLLWIAFVPDEYLLEIRGRLLSMAQMLALLFISYNLVRHARVARGMLWSLAVASGVMAVLQIAGITATTEMYRGEERVSTLAENLNSAGAELALGMLAMIALFYLKRPSTAFRRAAGWLVFATLPLVALGVVRTGSRGAVLALGAGIVVFLLQKGTAWVKFRNVAIAVIALGGLVWLSVLLNPKRWEETIGEGRLAGRERIYPAATQMFLERPLFGWGTVQNLYILGPRVGLVKRDTHNLALFVLTETGLAGGIPYFIGVGLAAAAAWRARRGPLGIAPVALMACLLVVNMSITWHVRKIHWLVLGLALASPAVVEPLPRRTAFPRPRPVRA